MDLWRQSLKLLLTASAAHKGVRRSAEIVRTMSPLQHGRMPGTAHLSQETQVTLRVNITNGVSYDNHPYNSHGVTIEEGIKVLRLYKAK